PASLDPFYLSVPAPAPPVPSTLSLHDALPIFPAGAGHARHLQLLGRAPVELVRRCGHRPPHVRDDELRHREVERPQLVVADVRRDRKSTRLNSSHVEISYAVFCLKKKKRRTQTHLPRCGSNRRLAIPSRSCLSAMPSPMPDRDTAACVVRVSPTCNFRSSNSYRRL